MPPQFNPRALKPGDVLTADYLNAMMRALQEAGALRVGGGLTVRRGPGGLQLARSGSDLRCVAGTVVANIPPRSGTTAGRGQLDLVAIDPATGAITTTGERIDVVCLSTATMTTGVSIKAGLYATAVEVAPGVFVVSPEDCT